jgi:3-hydroxybutyryl-CoA dehydrogenase
MLTKLFKKSFSTQNTIKSFGVVGSGQMGTGIAIVANKIANLNVTIYDSNQVALKKSQDFVQSWLNK